MRKFLTDLRHNLIAGFRLALMRPVSRLDFRFAPSQLIGCALVATLCTSLVDLALHHQGAQFNAAGIGGMIRDTALMLLFSWIVATALRRPGVLLSLPIVFFAAGWFPDVTFATIIIGVAATGVGGRWYLLILWWLVLGWAFVVAWRAVGVVLQGEGRISLVKRAAAVAVIFGGLLGVALQWPSPRLWEESAADANVEAAERGLPRVESEQVLATQPRLLFEALTGLEEREPGTTNTYFIGFAGDASQDVFRNDMEAAQEVVDKRLNTDGRSVVLINSKRTVLEAPLATVTNLRAALSTVGRLIDADDDVVMLYLSSHGTADHQLYVHFPPLELQQLTPVALSRLLQESGIRWKIIVVSACYSGGYIEPLRDANTIVITSSRADRTSFGCENKAEFTYFGQAFFQEALKGTDSVIEAFELAKKAVSRREKAEGLPPSEPQIHVGDAIRKKLGGGSKTKTLALHPPLGGAAGHT